VNCTTGDHYCITDTGVFSNPLTFGSLPAGRVTLLAQSAGECFENFPASAVDDVQQAAPGVFTWYSSATTCGSLGVSFYAGLLYLDSSVRVYTTSSSSAQLLCTAGLVTSCTSSPPPGPSYTDLWWNPAESGWGISLTHHPATNQIFVAWYTYDASGNSKWYVASSCPVSNGSCTGTLYETTGTPLSQAWNPALLNVRPVGSITLRFTNPTVAVMSYTVNGIVGSKLILRQSF
jgi:hypothetical protein